MNRHLWRSCRTSAISRDCHYWPFRKRSRRLSALDRCKSVLRNRQKKPLQTSEQHWAFQIDKQYRSCYPKPRKRWLHTRPRCQTESSLKQPLPLYRLQPHSRRWQNLNMLPYTLARRRRKLQIYYPPLRSESLCQLRSFALSVRSERNSRWKSLRSRYRNRRL